MVGWLLGSFATAADLIIMYGYTKLQLCTQMYVARDSRDVLVAMAGNSRAQTAAVIYENKL